MPIGVAANSNPRDVEQALIAAAGRVKGILQEPPPSVYFKGFGDFTLDFELLCWTQQMLSRRRAFVSEMNYAIWEELTRRGIEIPNPQRDLHIRSAEGLRLPSDSESGETLGMDSAKTRDVRREKQQ